MRRVAVCRLCGDRLRRRSSPRPAPPAPGLKVGISGRRAGSSSAPGTIEERARPPARARRRGCPRDARLAAHRAAARGRSTGHDADAWLDALRGAEHRAGRHVVGRHPAGRTAAADANVPPRSGATFAAFARAAAERYPWVRRWIVWNEPNQRRWLLPPSPTVYVTKLLNPAAAAIKSASPPATVAGGATAPRGGSGGTSPVDFIRGYGTRRRAARRVRTPPALALACRDADERRVRPVLDDHDGDPRTAPARDERRIRPANACLADRARVPDEPTRSRARRHVGASGAVPRRGAAAGICASRVDLLVQYLVRDEPRLDAWQSGLETVAGRAKPALAAFSLPLAQVGRHGRRDHGLGTGSARERAAPLPAPAASSTGAGRSLGGGTTTSRGHFTRVVRAGPGTVLRLLRPGDGAGRARHSSCSERITPTRRVRPRRARARRRRAAARAAARGGGAPRGTSS